MSDPQMGFFFGCSYFSVLARRAFFGRFIEFWRKKQYLLYSYSECQRRFLQTLRTCADLDFSNSTLVMLQHDRKPLPSPCAAQLVALAGGAPAMRYLESAIGSMGIALVLREIDPALAQDAVVMNTAAGER